MAVAVCVRCAIGACLEDARACAGTVHKGRATVACSCPHVADPAPGRVLRTGDPRVAGGAMVGVGDEALLDTSRAVLPDDFSVCRVDNPSDGRSHMALLVEGRINRTRLRSTILYLLGADDAAAIVSELVGLAARMGPGYESDFRALLSERMEVSDLWPAAVPS